MSTSGSRNFVAQVNEVIDAALDLVGRRNQGPRELAAEKNRALFIFNYVQQALSARNIRQAWTIEERNTLFVSGSSQTVTTASTATYQLGEDVIDVFPETFIVRRSSIDSPIVPMSIREYSREGNKTTTGKPTRVLIEKAESYTDSNNSRTIQGQFQVTFHPTPENSTDSIRYYCQRKLQDADSLLDEIDAPPFYTRAYIYGVAAELAVKHALPLPNIVDLRSEFEREVERVRMHDTPRGNMRLTPVMPFWGGRY